MLNHWIPGFEKRYAIYYWPDSGRWEVWSFHIVQGNRCVALSDKPVLKLKPFRRDNHWCVVLATKRRKQTCLHVARIIYQCFVGYLPKGKCVCHKDGNKKNFEKSNLILRTASEATRIGMSKKKRNRFTDSQVREIRARKKKMTQAQQAVQLGISARHLRRIISGEAYTHVS